MRLTDHTITGRLQFDSLRATSAYDLCVRVIECAEVIAADVFKSADATRQRITFGDVERYLAQLAGHPRGCSCGRCELVSRVTAQRVYAIASGWQRQIRATRTRGMP